MLIAILSEIEYGVILWGIGLISFLVAFIKQKKSEFVLTNKRLILKVGLISRKAVEIMLTKCEGVMLDQNVMGRIFGYGAIITTTGGVTTKFNNIKDPAIFRNYINTKIDEIQK